MGIHDAAETSGNDEIPMNFLELGFWSTKRARDTITSYGFLTFVSSRFHGDAVQYLPNVTALPALAQLSKGDASAHCRHVQTRSEAS
jgi:hypothetical protein